MGKAHLFLCASISAIAISCGNADASPCLRVTLTGTQSGPPIVAGLAGSGTLVEFGDEANQCRSVRLQFDAGRGTLIRLSQAGVLPNQLNAVFFHAYAFRSFGRFSRNRPVTLELQFKGPKTGCYL